MTTTTTTCYYVQIWMQIRVHACVFVRAGWPFDRACRSLYACRDRQALARLGFVRYTLARYRSKVQAQALCCVCVRVHRKVVILFIIRTRLSSK